MDSEELKDKVNDAFSKGEEVSKKAFLNAGAALQKFTDISVLKIEKSHLNFKADKLKEELGNLTYDLLSKQDFCIGTIDSIIESDKAAAEIFNRMKDVKSDIDDIFAEIEDKQKQIENIKKK